MMAVEVLHAMHCTHIIATHTSSQYRTRRTKEAKEESGEGEGGGEEEEEEEEEYADIKSNNPHLTGGELA